MLLATLRQWSKAGLFGRSLRKTADDADGIDLLDADLDDKDVLLAQRDAFLAARQTDAYRAVYHMVKPLVTVCITTSDRGAILRERALTSMLNQTYRHLQVVVVGDCCDDDTAERVAGLKDSRFTFVNLPERGPYPPPGFNRWRVAGTYPANEALRRAKGDLITHIDEDDTFSDERIEMLVKEIQATQSDIVFHPFWFEQGDGSWTVLGNGMFEHCQTGTSMIFYHRWLGRIPWDLNAFRFEEPGDWNRFRKFAALGAKTHFVPIPLTRHWKFPEREPFAPKPGERFLD